MLIDKKNKFLNLGCGNRYHKDWINLDFHSSNQDVDEYNLLNGIPYSDNTFDVVYHSHLLEHFSKSDALRFINECYRVLKPNGIIRIAVPDLEIIVKNYLKYLELASLGNRIAESNYDWIMLEMYDQCVRNHGGGEMKKYLKQKNIPNKEFIRERIGYFFDIMTNQNDIESKNWKIKVKNLIPIDQSRLFIKELKNKINWYKNIQLGKFRQSGEIHQWMYDSFSLTRLLKFCGFIKITKRDAASSSIKNWAQYNLDTEPNGTVYKPDSLFIEANK